MSRTGSFRVTAVLKPRLSACRSPDPVPAQVVMELAVMHNEQGVVRPKQLEEVQAQTEWKAKALENLATWSGSLPPLLPVTLHRMGAQAILEVWRRWRRCADGRPRNGLSGCSRCCRRIITVASERVGWG